MEVRDCNDSVLSLIKNYFYIYSFFVVIIVLFVILSCTLRHVSNIAFQESENDTGTFKLKS